MISLTIDGRQVELAEGSSVELSLALEEITAPAQVRQRTFPFTLPMNAHNRTALGFPEQALSSARFNRETHTGKVTCRGAVLIRGDIELTACESDAAGSGRYRLALRVPPPAWIESAALKKLSETPIDYRGVLNEGAIRQSWIGEAPVRFLPVKWDQEPPYGQARLTLRELLYDNYFPFVQIRALLEAIVGAAGYRIESQFLDDPFFRSLYMSGKYGGGATDKELLRMDFSARRSVADKAVASGAEGRVLTTVSATSNSVGNPVDTLEAAAVDGNSHALYGQSFRMIDSRAAFVPEAEVVVGFEFQLKIKAASPELLSAAEIRDIRRVEWDGETIWQQTYPNPLTDLKNTGGEKNTYRIICFDNRASVTRRLRIDYTRGVSVTVTFYQASYQYYIGEPFSRVHCEESVSGKWVTVEQWALYRDAEYAAIGFGTTRELNLTLHSTPRLRPADEPVFFDSLLFEVLPNTSFTLCQGSTIRPHFYTMPEAGSAVAFASLFAHERTQLELIEALVHLFGLHFYTDQAAKTIRVEPRFTFLDESREIDWTEKIDGEKPLAWEEMGSDRYRIETLEYRSGDVPTRRASAGTGKTFGEWSTNTTHRFARQGEKRAANPLFTATLDERNSLSTAPDASMIVVGDRSGKKTDRDSPEKIVRYLGMLPLPEGQRWGWPAAGQEYPAVGFSPAMDAFTLRFDDQDGQLGLRHYHRPLYELAEKGKKLTLYLHLTPSDIEAVRYPNSSCRDFRGNFVFRIRGEKLKARLVEISGYDPAANRSTRCTFTVEF